MVGNRLEQMGHSIGIFGLGKGKATAENLGANDGRSETRGGTTNQAIGLNDRHKPENIGKPECIRSAPTPPLSVLLMPKILVPLPQEGCDSLSVK